MSGVSTRDLMARMGHDSVRAAIIYQHATTEADALIAAALEATLAGDEDLADEDDDDQGVTRAAPRRRILPDDGELVAGLWPVAPIGRDRRSGAGCSSPGHDGWRR